MSFRLSFFFFLLLTTINVQAASPEEGEVLFKANCKACHHMEMRLVGPALKNVDQRHSEEWIYKFIKSSQSMIDAGDSTANALFMEYNQIPMPDQKLDDDQIASILSYIKAEGSAKKDQPIPRPVVVQSDLVPIQFTDFRFWITYTITIILLVVFIYYMAELKAMSKKLEQNEDPTG